MRRLEEVLDMPRGNLRVPDVYKSAGLTKTQLQTFSRQVLGLSVARYVRVRRLKQACQALLSIASRAEAAEVVKEYGFADLEKFAAAVRRAFGATASSLCLLNISNGSGHRGEGNQRRGRR
jgi:AraC-like DNA-binding protein